MNPHNQVNLMKKAMLFNSLCRAHGVPEPDHEFKFDAKRKWRIDYFWGNSGKPVAMEVQGAIFTGGRHVRGAALVREHEKLNHMAIAGIRVLFVTPKQLETGEAFELVRQALSTLTGA